MRLYRNEPACIGKDYHATVVIPSRYKGLSKIFNKLFGDFLRIYRVLPPKFKRATLVVFGYVFIQAVLEVAAIISISFLALSVTAPERLREIGLVTEVFKMFPRLAALSAEPRLFALLASLGAVSVIAAKNAMFAFVTKESAKLGEGISLFAGQAIFRNYLCRPYIDHLSNESGKMFQALSWRNEVSSLITQLLLVYTYLSISLSLIIVLLWATPSMILLVLLLVGIISGGVYKSLKTGLDSAGRDSAECSRTENTIIMNAMNGIRETLIYRQQEVFFNKFQAVCVAGVKNRVFMRMAPAVPTWVIETAGFLAIPITLFIMLTYQDASMARITGVMTVIMLIAWRLLPLINRALGAFVIMRSVRYAALDCLALLEEAMASSTDKLPEPDPHFVMRSGIAFSHVTFRYPRAEGDCLHDLTLTIPCGAKVGFIGQSGAGKSSIASILSGLVLPTEGEMLVDGRPLNPSEQAAYCRHIGYVPQAPYILSGSLAENVAFSQWGKPWDEEKVVKACAMAELDIVDHCGIDYQVGAGGAGLSGGQSQRLSIARALYADPSVLILDEATSALDTGVEMAIMNTIFNLPQNMTIIVIAHRLTTVERCDILFWIDGGALVASGSPHELLPRYQEFLNARAGQFQP